MLKINFYPESDNKTYIKAAKEYGLIWQKEGDIIVKLIEDYSGMKFTTKIINAVTYDEVCASVPMAMESDLTIDFKRGALVHELIHRLLVDNDFWFYGKVNWTEIVHRTIYLILFDIWVEMLGEGKAQKNMEHEISYGDRDYKNAWKWALSLSKPERKKQFEKMRTKYRGKMKTETKI